MKALEGNKGSKEGNIDQRERADLLLERRNSINLFFFFLRAAPTAYGGSQASGPIGAVAARLSHSHSISGSQLCLRPTPQLTEMLDP